MKTFQRCCILACAVWLCLACVPALRAEVDDNIQNYLKLLRSDFNAGKIELINRIMNLSADEAKKFWPMYREYENELGKLAIDRTELTADFVQSHQKGTFTNAKAKDMAKRWFKGQRARLDLLEKYHDRIEKDFSAIKAGQFLQVENQLGLFIDVTIASEMPVVGQQKK